MKEWLYNQRLLLVHWTSQEVSRTVDTTRPSLLMRIRDRADADAWHAFDEIYRPMLYRFATACRLDHADAEDVSQHCLTAIANRISDFAYDPKKGKFKGWLRTMVNNRVRNLMRDRKDRPGKTDDFERNQQREPQPDEVFDKIWMEEHLWHCLRELKGEVDESTYKAFQLYVLEQKPIEEVCAGLSMTPNNVYTIKWRMTEKVGAKMKDLLDDDE